MHYCTNLSSKTTMTVWTFLLSQVSHLFMISQMTWEDGWLKTVTKFETLIDGYRKSHFRQAVKNEILRIQAKFYIAFFKSQALMSLAKSWILNMRSLLHTLGDIYGSQGLAYTPLNCEKKVRQRFIYITGRQVLIHPSCVHVYLQCLAFSLPLGETKFSKLRSSISLQLFFCYWKIFFQADYWLHILHSPPGGSLQ